MRSTASRWCARRESGVSATQTTWPSFLFQLGRPIDNQSDGCARLPGFKRNNKSLTVGANIESPKDAVGAGCKELVSAANFKTRTAGLHFRSHHSVVRGNVENFFAIAPP